jgi:hypothetical protein
VGYDGLTDTAELRKFSGYLNALGSIYGINSAIFQNAEKDPSSDDFQKLS